MSARSLNYIFNIKKVNNTLMELTTAIFLYYLQNQQKSTQIHTKLFQINTIEV